MDNILRRIIAIIVCGILGTAASVRCFGANATDSLLKILDHKIENRPEYIALKEKRLAKLRKDVFQVADSTERFHKLGALLDEYASFNTDSSIRICRERDILASRIGNRDLMVHARLSMANILVNAGQYPESLAIVDSIPRSHIPEYLRPFYYHIKRTLYGYMADYAVREEDKGHYSELTSQYRDSLISVNEEGTIYKILILADKLNNNGKPDEAKSILEQWLSAHGSEDTHNRAIMAYTLSEAYRRLGLRKEQKRELAIAAIADMESAVREYVALRQLAVMLYEDGDIERAYKYLKQSMNDATLCNARLRQVEINHVFPIVNDLYLNKIKAQQRRLRLYLIIISLLAVAAVTAYIIAVKQMRNARRARQGLADANERLVLMNDELKDVIGKLRDVNRELEEASGLKVEYIGEYMSQCSAYIDKLDSLSKKINNRLSTGSIEKTKELLKRDIVEQEIKAFYEHFDITFLRLFPTFVEDFNELLEPDKRIVPKTSGRLNTELRIFALIRLGVNDSGKIARFLRYSVTTIYNYRTKVRNKAAGDRDELEKKLMLIGSSKSIPGDSE